LSNEKAFILLFDKVNETQRGQIQAAIEASGAKWFHQQSNHWIVIGGPLRSVREWRSLVEAYVKGVPGNVLVLSLPEENQREFSGFAPKTWYAWLRDELKARSLPEKSVEPRSAIQG
jgi:hypothetical protein